MNPLDDTLVMGDNDYPRRCARQFMFDGWYFSRSWAEDVLRFIDGFAGTTVFGIVEAENGEAWGVLYTSDRVWFSNHLVTVWSHFEAR